MLDQLTQRVQAGAGPTALMLCAEGPDASAVMQELRSMRRGVSIPVTLCGRLGGAIRDLADVLDLGADQFLEEPFEDLALANTLTALAGSPPAPPVDAASASTAVGIDGPMRTELLDPMVASQTQPRSATAAGGARSTDPALGRLGRTLDLLESRLRTRNDALASESSDELERSLLGLDPAPVVEVDPGASGILSADLLTDAGVAEPMTDGGRRLSPVSPVESTTRLEGVSSTHAVPSRGGASTWTDVDAAGGGRRRVALSVEHEGDLAELDLPRLLWALHESRFTGRVDVSTGPVEKQLWMTHGELAFARSSETDDRLASTLVRRGMLTRSQFDAARSLAAKDPRRVGRLLVEAGFLKADALPAAIRAQVQGIVTSMFVWRRGRWLLLEGERCEEAVRLDVSVPRMLMAGLLDRMDTPQLETLMGGRDGFVGLHASVRTDALAHDLGLDPSQRGLLTMLDGRRDLHAVCAAAGLPDRVVLATVYGLLVVGAAQTSGEPLAESGAADPQTLDRGRVEERLRLVREVDYFELLGLSRDANAADVGRAHRELSGAFCDDVLDPAVRTRMRDELEEIRAALDDAAALLSEDDLRLAYLAHLDVP